MFTSGVKRILRAIDDWMAHVPTDVWVDDMMVKAQLAKHRAEKERERQIEQEPVKTAMGLTHEKVENFSSPGFITVDKRLTESEKRALKHHWSIGWKKKSQNPMPVPKGPEPLWPEK